MSATKRSTLINGEREGMKGKKCALKIDTPTWKVLSLVSTDTTFEPLGSLVIFKSISFFKIYKVI